MIVLLVPCGASEWREEGRLLGRVELSASTAAREQYDRWADALRPLAPLKICHAPDELATATAIELSLRLSVPVKAIDALDEVDVGLWSGLTDAELESRYESTHHELQQGPLNVTPPQGENLGDAAKRLKTAVQKCCRSVAEGKSIAIVLRPLALAIVRSQLTDGDESKIWEHTQEADEPAILEVHKAAGKRG